VGHPPRVWLAAARLLAATIPTGASSREAPAPSGTPAPALARLPEGLRAVDAEFSAPIVKLGFAVSYLEGDAFKRVVEADAKRFGEAVRRAGR
jgi:tripartite-type tricarboxylate transporter receptor subunit TctC